MMSNAWSSVIMGALMIFVLSSPFVDKLVKKQKTLKKNVEQVNHIDNIK